VVPDDVPARRAVLAGPVETAVNALWDARPVLGDRVAVVGAGMVGLCVARLLALLPGADVTVVDTESSRAEVAEAFGARFSRPGEAADDLDVVIHASGTAAGLQTSLDMLAADGVVTDLSWYGDAPVELTLGGRFHSARLGIRASQVGEIGESRRGRRTPADRMALALRLLADPVFDLLLTGESDFAELPEVMSKLATGSMPALCHTITYLAADGPGDAR
jgi:threonine dehydrogenase-like Zn-dependent dehydrogenase